MSDYTVLEVGRDSYLEVPLNEVMTSDAVISPYSYVGLQFAYLTEGDANRFLGGDWSRVVKTVEVPDPPFVHGFYMEGDPLSTVTNLLPVEGVSVFYTQKGLSVVSYYPEYELGSVNHLNCDNVFFMYPGKPHAALFALTKVFYTRTILERITYMMLLNSNEYGTVQFDIDLVESVDEMFRAMYAHLDVYRLQPFCPV